MQANKVGHKKLATVTGSLRGLLSATGFYSRAVSQSRAVTASLYKKRGHLLRSKRMKTFHRLSRSPFAVSSPPWNLTKRRPLTTRRRRHRHRHCNHLSLHQHNIPTTLENLPCEVLSEIFVRLLAKEAAQMRCVCKSWNALLSDSSFIKSHLHRSIHNNDEILLFFSICFSFEQDPKPFRVRPSCSPDLELTNVIRPPVIPQCRFGMGHLIGSANGLICFSYISDRLEFVLHIWNPSLSAILSLPPLPMSPRRLHCGFGFDPKSDDYKILNLTSFSAAPNKVVQAEVYSMRKGSWKLISLQTFPPHIIIPRSNDNQVCVDDNLHWLCETHLESKPQTILGFDLGEDAFIEIPLPDAILDFKVYKAFNVLGVVGGKLCVISRVRDGECEVWVMNEYGVAESWVKTHVFSQFGGDIFPYGFTSHGEVLFQVGVNDDRFALYDPVTTKTKTFKIKSRKSSVMKFVEYVDSLVWVPPPKRKIKVKRESKKRKQDIGARVKRSK